MAAGINVPIAAGSDTGWVQILQTESDQGETREIKGLTTCPKALILILHALVRFCKEKISHIVTRKTVLFDTLEPSLWTETTWPNGLSFPHHIETAVSRVWPETRHQDQRQCNGT